MKTLFSKTTSLLLVVMMIFGMSAVGFAEVTDDGANKDLCQCTTDIYIPERLPVGDGEIQLEGSFVEGNYGYNVVDNKAVIVDVSVSGDVTVPSSLGGYEVTEIGELAFHYYGSGVTSLTLPEGLTVINSLAFLDCDKLESVTIPDSVTTIGDHAFWGCSSLKSVAIPKNVEKIDSGAFKDCLSLSEITVDSANKYFSADGNGVLFNKDKTELILYPAGNARTSYAIPDSVKTIGYLAFSQADNLTAVTIPDSVTSTDMCAFSECENISDVYFSGSKNQWSVIEAEVLKCLRESLSAATLHLGFYNVNWVVEDNQTTQEVRVGTEISAPEEPAKSGYTFKGWSPEIPAVMPEKDLTFTAVFEKIPEIDIYNLGEETYSFSNFSDTDSPGHCFAMSATSAGYYLGELDINSVITQPGQDLYDLTLTPEVKAALCYYQPKQGAERDASNVAGGSVYLKGRKDINSDWNEVVNYVKNHEYDNKGTLQIGFRRGTGGHAINFLRYEEVNGQARIYAYDNNYPDVETYFYKDSNGDVRQAPKSTFGAPIDCIALRSIPTYFSLVGGFKVSDYIYAPVDTIAVSGATEYLMEGTVNGEDYAMYKVPENAEQVVIVPLVDNAEFTYFDETYSFGNVDDDTVGVFRLASDDENDMQDVGLQIVNVKAEIRTPSTTKIAYGDKIVLHADVKTLPDGATIKWTADNDNFAYSANGETCTIEPNKSGSTTFTVTVYDAQGNAISEDEQTMMSKAGFFDRFIAFFKKIFGITKTIPQFYNNIF